MSKTKKGGEKVVNASAPTPRGGTETPRGTNNRFKCLAQERKEAVQKKTDPRRRLTVDEEKSNPSHMPEMRRRKSPSEGSAPYTKKSIIREQTDGHQNGFRKSQGK